MRGVLVEPFEAPPLLRVAEWTMRRGEHWLLFGPNGSGKTTLLRLVTGYLWATEGEVALFGETYGQGAHLPSLRRRIGYVSSALSQTIAPWNTGLEVALTGLDASLDIYHGYGEDDKGSALKALEQAGVAHLAERAYEVCSQGERQKLLLARALVARPELLILDEACAGLDPVARCEFLERIEQLAARPDSPSIIMTTHHLEEAGSFLTHALLLSGGQVVAQGEIGIVLNETNLGSALGRSVRLRRHQGIWNLSVVSAPAQGQPVENCPL